MVDETAGKDLVVHRPTGLVGDYSPEPTEPKTVREIIEEFAKRRDRITVIQHARILFDPKSLPGVTPKEAMEFLLKGLQIDDPEVKKKLTGKSGAAIRYNFEDFIDVLKQQNNAATVADIWNAVDADPIKKMALQWEIQAEHQLIEEAIEESADRTAVDLGKLDGILKKAKGDEIFVSSKEISRHVFHGLTVSDDEGLRFVKDPDNVPYRNLVFGGPAAYSTDGRNFERSEGLSISSEARHVIRTETEKYWKDALDDNGFHMRRHDQEFDPENNFPSIITGEEFSKIRGLNPNSSDPSTDVYDKLAATLKEPQKPT